MRTETPSLFTQKAIKISFPGLGDAFSSSLTVILPGNILLSNTTRLKEQCMRGDYEVITFKADRDLLEAMEGIANRSAFIRQAILAALDSTCPVCSGTGVLTPSQQSHWSEFMQHHRIEKCTRCSEIHLVCDVQ
jgi:hypothetical protein